MTAPTATFNTTSPQRAYTQYRDALMRHRYTHGKTLDQIVSEFDATPIDLQIALGPVLSSDDQARVDNAINHQFATWLCEQVEGGAL